MYQKVSTEKKTIKIIIVKPWDFSLQIESKMYSSEIIFCYRYSNNEKIVVLN